MNKEIIQGIFGGLFIIVVVVGIGSQIGQALSHGPTPAADATAPASAEDSAAPAGEATP